MAATPNCQLVEAAVLAAFPNARFGRYNCRHIGSNAIKPWSQHAGSEPARRYFGNALDIWHVDHKPAGKPADSSPAHQTWLRAVRAFITLNYAPIVDQMLGPGDNAAHANHLHMSTWPKMKSNWWYTPPCKGGELVVIHEDGTTGTTFEEEEMITRNDKADDGLGVHDQNFQEAVDAGVMSSFTQPGGVAFNDEIATFLARAGVLNIAALEARITALEASGNGLQDGDTVKLNKV